MVNHTYINTKAYRNLLAEIASMVPTTDAELWEQIRSKTPSSRAFVAKYAVLSTEMVSILAHDQDMQVVIALAANPSVSPATLEVLAQTYTESQSGHSKRTRRGYRQEDLRDELVKALLSNPELPSEALLVLAASSSSSSWEVRTGIARHPNTPNDILSQYAGDIFVVRKALLENPNLPDGTRKSLEEWRARHMIPPDTEYYPIPPAEGSAYLSFVAYLTVSILLLRYADLKLAFIVILLSMIALACWREIKG